MTDRTNTPATEPLADSAGHEMADVGKAVDHERIADLNSETTRAREAREDRSSPDEAENEEQPSDTGRLPAYVSNN